MSKGLERVESHSPPEAESGLLFCQVGAARDIDTLDASWRLWQVDQGGALADVQVRQASRKAAEVAQGWQVVERNPGDRIGDRWQRGGRRARMSSANPGAPAAEQ